MGRKPLTQEEAERKSLAVGVRMTGEYKGNNIPTSFECPYCKIIFLSTPGHIWGRTIKSCGCLLSYASSQRAKNPIIRQKIAKSRRIPKGNNSFGDQFPELVQQWHPTKNGDLTPYTVNKGSQTKAWFICKNGHEYYSRVSQRTSKNKTNCPICAGRLVLTGVNDLQTTNFILCTEWDYDKNTIKPTEVTYGSHRKVFWKCKICGNLWKTSICNRAIQQTGCPVCSSSKGEQRLKEILDKYDVQYIREKSFDELVSKLGNPLRFDFYVSNLNLCIEFQGIQHYGEHKGHFEKSYKTTQKHDKLKRQYCQDHNIKLLEISYKDYDKIEEILVKNLNIQENV